MEKHYKENILERRARLGTDEKIAAFFALLLVFVEELVVGVESGFALGLTGLGCHAHPLKFTLEGLAAFRCLL